MPKPTKPPARTSKPAKASSIKTPSSSATAAIQPATKAAATSSPSPNEDPLIAWARACLLRATGLLDGELPARPPGGLYLAVGRVFGLDDTEVALLQLAHAVEKSSAVSVLTHGGLTVELARAALDLPIDAALASNRALRRYALVVTDGEGAVGATTKLQLGPGLAPRLEGRAARAELGPGVYRIGPAELPAVFAGADTRLPPLANEISVQEDAARLCTIANCGRKEALQIGALLAHRLQRGLTFLDGESLKLLGPAWRTLAAARRDAELDGEVLVLAEALAVGEAWRAAATQPATLAPRAAVFIVADAGSSRDLFLLPGWRHHTFTLAAVSAAAVAAEKTRVVDDGLDHVRQMAVRDAERALGIVRAPPPPPRPSVPGVMTSAQLPPQRALPTPTAEPSTPVIPVAATPVAPVAAPPKRGKRSAKAIAMFGPGPDDDYDDEPAPPPRAAAPPPPPLAPIPSAALTPELIAAEATAYIEVAEDASVAVLARVAMTSGNPRQRAEILTALHGVKEANVMAAMRANSTSPHPTLRAVAEQGMSLLFGPNWNVSRAVPRPVQAPTDGKDRGPPGGL